MIKILSDSTCDLSKELVERYDLGIIPLYVRLGEKEYLDGVNITPEELYKWSDEHFGTKATCQLIDGYWSQVCWAWASISMLIALTMSLYIRNFTLALAVALLIVIYTYLLPVFAHMVLSTKTHVRVIDWLVLPISIFIKCIGPNWFILEKLLKKNVTFKKVER